MKKKGSISAEKSEEVAKQTTATDTVDTFIDSKKHNQWKVTKAPTPKRPRKSFLLTLNNCFLKARKIAILTKAIPILYQTKWIALNEINFPNTPVNPKITTIRCNEVSLYFFSMLYMN